MRILITTIPHEQQRYDTTDDWQIADNGDITMYVSDGEQLEVFKEIIHGLTECLLCIKHGVTQQQVDEYDLAHPETDNPGEYADASYHLEHKAAEVAEKLLDL